MLFAAVRLNRSCAWAARTTLTTNAEATTERVAPMYLCVMFMPRVSCVVLQRQRSRLLYSHDIKRAPPGPSDEGMDDTFVQWSSGWGSAPIVSDETHYTGRRRTDVRGIGYGTHGGML